MTIWTSTLVGEKGVDGVDEDGRKGGVEGGMRAGGREGLCVPLRRRIEEAVTDGRKMEEGKGKEMIENGNDGCMWRVYYTSKGGILYLTEREKWSDMVNPRGRGETVPGRKATCFSSSGTRHVVATGACGEQYFPIEAFHIRDNDSIKDS